jgi:DNA-binding transcriptional LysR family regulator
VDLADLRRFVVVAEERNLRRAAARMHLAQPALSRRIQALERELGAPLLTRHPRGVAPTLAGEAFARGAGEVLTRLLEALERAEAVGEGRRGRVVLGATLAAIASGLPGAVADELRRERPDIELVVEDCEPPVATERVRDGGADVAISWADALGASLVAEPLWREVLDHATVPARHPLGSRGRLTVPQLGDLALVLPQRAVSPQLTKALLAALHASGLRSPLTVLDISMRDAHLAIAAGRGWLVMSRSRSTAPPAGTVSVPLDGFRFQFDAVAIWRRGERRPVVRTVAEKVLDVARRHPAQCVAPEPRLPSGRGRGGRRRPSGFLPPGLELRHLRALLEVAAAGTIGRAAERLGVTQPALSRQLKELERMLDLPLLERSARGVALTSAGTSLAGDCPGLFRQLDHVVQETTRARRGMEGRCVIGAVATAAASELLGRVLVTCAERHPHVHVVIEEMGTPEQPAALLRGDVDLGLAHAYPVAPAEETLAHERVFEDRLQAALLSPDHPLAGRRLLSVSDLADVPLLFMGRTFHPQFYDRMMAALRALGLTPRVDATYDGLQAVWSLAAQGRGWAFGFRSHRRSPPSGTVAIPVAGLDVPWGLDLLWRRAEPSRAVRSVARVIREAARPRPSGGRHAARSPSRSRRRPSPRRRSAAGHG